MTREGGVDHGHRCPSGIPSGIAIPGPEPNLARLRGLAREHVLSVKALDLRGALGATNGAALIPPEAALPVGQPLLGGAEAHVAPFLVVAVAVCAGAALQGGPASLVL